MTLEMESNTEDAAAIAKTAPLHRRERPDASSPLTRFHATALHSLDPIKGWLPVDCTLSLSPSTRRNLWREDRVSSRRTPR